jgi:predicted ATPase/class 3 adenylate cyclase
MLCPTCGTDNRQGRKFCAECGSTLAVTCAACGSPNEPGERFCGDCGASLDASSPLRPPAPAPRRPPSEAERRLVSVLFADLVGFTTLSETRDAEEVREILSRYFERCRRLINLYGGTVEKFIGDAVMAVWGAPLAQEDDAERAVRAALDLVAAVEALGQEIGAPDLRARAAVLTGTAAVTLAAEGQGMVAGDLVNTASRVQSLADPGTVLVSEATRRATEAAIAYADAGNHALKGKAQPITLARAVRVTAGRKGALKSAGLEPPFVGRDRELRLVKELFHASAEERKARLVSVIGIGGIGKSRLSWEFFKYIDGLAENIWWHRGRSVAYGEGITYWALAEMVRMRAEIAEGEEPASARAKLRAAIELHVSQAREREWVEPRLAQLVGLEERASGEREDLFAAWRLFFERMSESAPVVMAFEDMQWADISLLEFVEYLLEWSRNHPIYVLALARPEVTEHHPTWGARARSFTSLTLEPLPPTAMQELLDGLVPGLPPELRAQVLERAEGIPLYAVETVRMLLDRGLLERIGDQYRPRGRIETLEVPETLHALIAARLDGLSSDERRLLQDASVLGKAFTKEAVAAVGGRSDELDPLLASLVRKEVLSLQGDPRSPERGQYGFLQDLLRRVAYETLARRERKERHLAAAAHLEGMSEAAEQEPVELVAAHYLAAYEAAPDAHDAAAIRAKAQEMLVRGGERAASLSASTEAQHYFEQAAELTDAPLEQAQLLERAGEMAWVAGHGEAASTRFERAISLFQAEGESHAAARVSARLGEMIWAAGRIDEAVERMERSFAVLSDDRPDADLAALAAQLGRLLFFTGDADRAAARIEQALEMAESLGLPEVLSQALTTKGIVLVVTRRRPQEGLALIRHALKVGLDNDLPSAALRAYSNLANILYHRDDYESSLAYAQEGLDLARRFGDRSWEWSLLADMVAVLFLTGEWDEAVSRAEAIPHLEDFEATEEFTGVRFSVVELLLAIPQIYLARGRVEDAEDMVRQFGAFGDSADEQERTAYAAAAAAVFRGQGRLEEALSSGLRALEGRDTLGGGTFYTKLGFVEAVEAAFELGDLDRVENLFETTGSFGAGEATPFLDAQVSRFRGRLAAVRADMAGAERGFKAAAALMREIDLPFWLAITLLEHAEAFTGCGRPQDAERLLAEAQELFEQLGATPWLERTLRATQTSVPEGEPVGERS